MPKLSRRKYVQTPDKFSNNLSGQVIEVDKSSRQDIHIDTLLETDGS